MADTSGTPIIPDRYKSAPNGESPPFRASGVPPVDIREVIPHTADKVINPPPIPANGFRPGAAADYEYVSGHKSIFFSQYIKALGPYIDDLTQDLGDDIYERMMNDSQIDSCMRILKAGILSEEGKIQSPILDEKSPKYEMGQKVAKFIEFCVKRLPLPLTCTLEEMLDGTALGHKTAEIIYEAVDYQEMNQDGSEGQTRKVWVVESIRTKPRGSTAFLVDAYMRVLGVLGQIPGLPYPIVSGQLVSDPSTIPNLLPRKKFFIFTNDPRDMDPRGRSSLRSSYTPWWFKQQTMQEELKYMAIYAVPSLIAITAEGAQEKVETDPTTGLPTGKIISPEQDNANTLAKIRGGSAGAFSGGTSIVPLPVPSTANSVFIQAKDWSDKQIAKAILASTLATEEGQHMARAASDNHMDILELGLRLKKARLGSCVKQDLFYALVEFNYGKKIADEYTPDYVLTDMNRSDWAMWSGVAVSMFSSGYLTIEQKQWIDKKLGLPKSQTDKGNDLPGNTPAKYIIDKLAMDMQAQQAQQQMQMEQQAQATQQQQGQQGMVPQGLQSPNHPNNQQARPQPEQAAA